MAETTAQSSARKPLTRFLFALLCGGAAVTLVYLHQEQTLIERSGGPRQPVLIAKTGVPARGRIDAQNIGQQDVPRDYVHVDSIPVSEREKIAGRRLYRAVRQNQPLLWSDFDPPEAERTVALPRGQRATLVSLGDALGKSHLLAAGDYVDILVHLNLQDLGSFTATLLQRVQVVEVIGSSALVALTPEQAEQLVFARASGTLTLALRGREDIEQRELPHITIQRLAASLNLGDVPLPGSQPDRSQPSRRKADPRDAHTRHPRSARSR